MPTVTSWTLLRRLLLIDGETNPFFQRELVRPPIWQVIAAWMARATGLMLVTSGMVCYISVLLVFYLRNVLILLIPLVGLWGLLLAVTLAPIVAQERASLTWDTLRLTPWDLADVLLSKAGGALWWMRSLLRLLFGVVIVLAIGIGMVSLLLSTISSSDANANVPPMLMCVSTVLIPFSVAALYVADRVQFFILSLLAALAASAATHTIRNAISGALVALFGVWLLDVALTVMLFQFRLDASVGWNLLSVGALGPVAGFIGQFTLRQVLMASVAVLMLREAVVILLWRWTLRAAQNDY